MVEQIRLMKVRHNRSKALWAVVVSGARGVELRDLRAHQGPIPARAREMVGSLWSDHRSLRAALVAAYK